MVKRKSKKLWLLFLLGMLFVTFATTWWCFRIRIPNVYGQLYYHQSKLSKLSNLSTTDRYIPSQLIFNGKTYENINTTKLGKSVNWGLRTVGQVKLPQNGDGPIVIWNVLGHPDLVLVDDNTDMTGWSVVFQEEKK